MLLSNGTRVRFSFRCPTCHRHLFSFPEETAKEFRERMIIYHALLHHAHKAGFHGAHSVSVAKGYWRAGFRPDIFICVHNEQELIDRAKNNRKGVQSK